MSNAKTIYQQGGVIAYPTEAVFGLGCDPDNIDAIKKILAIKNRPKEKGLILLASHYHQLSRYIDDSDIAPDLKTVILSRWPNGTTQLLKKSANLSEYVCGQFDTIAVRITDHPDVVALCEAVGKPIVSTSANLSGQEPAKTWQEVEATLGNQVDFIIKSNTLGFTKPSTIINAYTGETIRQ
ncbi:L-threonylcarbamoyladenylate synthase [Thalassotalea ganghwensis]